MPVPVFAYSLLPCGWMNGFFQTSGLASHSLGALAFQQASIPAGKLYQAQLSYLKPIIFQSFPSSPLTLSTAPLKLQGGGSFQFHGLFADFNRLEGVWSWRFNSGWQCSLKKFLGISSGMEFRLDWVGKKPLQRPPAHGLPSLSLQSDTAEVRARKVELERNYLDTRKQIQVKAQEVNNEASAFDQARQRYESSVQDFHAELPAYKETEGKFEQEKADYENALHHLLQKKSDLQLKKDQFRLELTKLVASLSAFKNSETLLQRNITAFCWDLEDLKTTHSFYQSELMPYVLELWRFKSDYGDFEEEYEKLLFDFKKLRLITIENLEMKSQWPRWNGLQIQKEKAQYDTEKARLQSEKERLNGARQQLQSEHEAFEAENFQMLEKKSNLAKKEASLQEQAQQLAGVHQNLCAERDTLQKKIKELVQFKENLIEKQKQLEVRYSQLKPEFLEREFCKAAQFFFEAIQKARNPEGTQFLDWQEGFLNNVVVFNTIGKELEAEYKKRAREGNNVTERLKLQGIEEISYLEAESARLNLAYQGIISPWFFLQRILGFFQVKIQEQDLDKILDPFETLNLDLQAWRRLFETHPIKKNCIAKMTRSLHTLQRNAGHELFTNLIVESIGKYVAPNARAFHKDPEVQSSLVWFMYLHFNIPSSQQATFLENQLAKHNDGEVTRLLDNFVIENLALLYRSVVHSVQLLESNQLCATPFRHLFNLASFRQFQVHGGFLYSAMDTAGGLAKSKSSRTSDNARAKHIGDWVWRLIDQPTWVPGEIESRGQRLNAALTKFSVVNREGYLSSNLTTLRTELRDEAMQKLFSRFSKGYEDEGNQPHNDVDLEFQCTFEAYTFKPFAWFWGEVAGRNDARKVLEKEGGTFTRALQEKKHASKKSLGFTRHESLAPLPLKLRDFQAFPLVQLHSFESYFDQETSSAPDEATSSMSYEPVSDSTRAETDEDSTFSGDTELTIADVVLACPSSNCERVYFGGHLPEYSVILSDSMSCSLPAWEVNWKACWDVFVQASDLYLKFKGHLGQTRALERMQQEMGEIKCGNLKLETILKDEVLTEINQLKSADEAQQQELGNRLNALTPAAPHAEKIAKVSGALSGGLGAVSVLATCAGYTGVAAVLPIPMAICGLCSAGCYGYSYFCG